MMQSDVNLVTLFDGTVIGRVEPWADDPATFDGWLELEGKTDRLVVNGANRSWAVAEVAREYIHQATAQAPEERDGLLNCDLAAWRARENRLRRVREASEIHTASIGEHYRSGGNR